MNKEEEVGEAHPEGEVQVAGNQPAETVASLDTFAGKIHVKWAPEATVSSLGLMPFFIEFLKTSGLFEKWVEDCPLHYSSGNAPDKRHVLGTLLLSVVAGHWRHQPGVAGTPLRRANARPPGRMKKRCARRQINSSKRIG
jgi:hypothetical protein